jgi:hypothetical protein
MDVVTDDLLWLEILILAVYIRIYLWIWCLRLLSPHFFPPYVALL